MRNNTVGAYDAKTRFSELLERVETGAEITITKHGTPVASTRLDLFLPTAAGPSGMESFAIACADS